MVPISKTSPGRHDHRQYQVFDLTEEKYEHIAANFEDRKQAVRITRTTQHKASGKKTVNVAYALTSLSSDEANAEHLGALIRGHWGIENKLHYVKDVTYREDKSQSYKGNIPAIWSQLNNLAIAIITLHNSEFKQEKTTSEKCIRFTHNQNKVMDAFMKPISLA